MAQRNTDHHQTYPFGALSDWNMTLISFLCVSVCSSTVCWSGQLQRPQRPPGPRSFSGTQWVDNRRQSARFFGPRVNSPTDIFTLSSIKSSEVNLIYICVCVYIYLAWNHKSKNVLRVCSWWTSPYPLTLCLLFKEEKLGNNVSRSFLARFNNLV